METALDKPTVCRIESKKHSLKQLVFSRLPQGKRVDWQFMERSNKHSSIAQMRNKRNLWRRQGKSE